MSEVKRVKFVAEFYKQVFPKNANEETNYRICAMNVDKEKNEDVYDELKFNKYGNITLVGDLPELYEDVDYTIEAEEKLSKNKAFGYQYNVIRITRQKPTNKTQSKKFLTEILTHNQAETLLKAYPNIIDKIINNDLDDIDLNKTKGIKEKLFEKIKYKVIQNFCLMELIDKYTTEEGEQLLSFSVLKKLYNNYSSVEKIENAIKKYPYETLCNLSGIGFKTADKVILKLNPNMINNIQRTVACIKYLLSENENNGNTYMNTKELHKEIGKLIPEAMHHFATVIKDNKDLYISSDKKIIANRKTYETELFISNKIKELLIKPNKWCIDYKKYIENDGVKLTEQQSFSLKNLCDNNISLLVGYSGSGKSQTTQAIISMLEDNDKTYRIMASTGKASKVIATYCQRPATTIHRGLGFNPEKGWLYNHKNPLDVDVVIVDETSMVDIFLAKHLLDAIDVNRTKLVFVFDEAQIPSVSCGKFAYDMINSEVIPYTRLTKIFRYGEGGLYWVATETRNGNQFVESTHTGVKNFGNNKDYSLISVPQEKTIDYTLKLYQHLLNNGNTIDDIMVTMALNKGDYGAIEVNRRIQEIANPPSPHKKEIKLKINTFREQDKVMQIVNNYTAINSDYEKDTIFNGDTGTIIKIKGDEVFVDYGDKVIIYGRNDLDQLMLAYAVNIYKMQGSSAKNIILLTPKAHTYMLNRNLLYTGQTRAKQRVYHIGSPKTINIALKKSANYERRTFLKDMLMCGV